MSDPHVRVLSAGDHADVLNLLQELSGDIPVAASHAEFAALLAHPGTSMIGAERAGQIVAMATLHILPNLTQSGRPYGLVENVVTLSTARKQGYGRAVMAAVISRADAAGCYKIMLLTGSAAAVGFYERLGFDGGEKHGMIIRRGPKRADTTMQKPE